MTQLRRFGEAHEPGEYAERPGAYGLVMRQPTEVLVVQANGRTHLPGGGIEPGESTPEALHREFAEECGVRIRHASKLVSAIQYVSARGEGSFRKVCHYFLVEISGEPSSVEAHTTPLWLPMSDALITLSHESHRYALQVALERTT